MNLNTSHTLTSQQPHVAKRLLYQTANFAYYGGMDNI